MKTQNGGKPNKNMWFDEWEYPRNVGVIIADTISGGNGMIYLDYIDCSKDIEPKVSICLQEGDFELIVISSNYNNNFTICPMIIQINQSFSDIFKFVNVTDKWL